MADAYDGLVKTGAIGSLKRDILLGAADDIYYLAHVRRWFGTASAEAAKTATACTVRVVRELIEKNLCSLARWGKEKGSFEVVAKTPEELTELVDKTFDTMPFDFFLIATDSGNQWVARYQSLVNEL